MQFWLALVGRRLSRPIWRRLPRRPRPHQQQNFCFCEGKRLGWLWWLCLEANLSQILPQDIFSVASLVSTCSTLILSELKKKLASGRLWKNTLQGTITYPTKREKENHRLRSAGWEGYNLYNSQCESGNLYCQASRRQVSSLLASALERMVHRAFHAWHSLKVEIWQHDIQCPMPLVDISDVSLKRWILCALNSRTKTVPFGGYSFASRAGAGGSTAEAWRGTYCCETAVYKNNPNRKLVESLKQEVLAAREAKSDTCSCTFMHFPNFFPQVTHELTLPS